MSDISYLFRGLVIGFSIAAPVGPIGVLCIRRTLADGRAVGFASGLGAATADAAYGSIAAFGLTAVSVALVGQQALLRLVGGAFLCYLGARTFAARPAGAPAVGESSAGGTQAGEPAPAEPARAESAVARPASAGPASSEAARGLPGAYASTFFLTLTNPMTILSFAAIFAGLGLASAPGTFVSAGSLVAGVFLGSAAWWLVLSTGAGAMRSRFSPAGLRWVNRVSGAIIAAFGLVALVSVLGQ